MQTIPYIEFKDVDFSYQANQILCGVNFVVDESIFLCIIGGSGSGKTTLLKLISGQLFPQKGMVLVKGRPTTELTKQEMYEHRKNMGYLFQQGALFTDLTVADNIAFPVKEHTQFSESEIQALVQEKLASVGLEEAKHQYPLQLSGGMVKRAALARAIALNPSLLIYDEPFSGLDPISLRNIANLIGKINSVMRATSIMVTHSIRESLSIVDKVVLLDNKTIAFEGAPRDILNSSNESVQEFLEAAFISHSTYERGWHV